MSQNNMPAMKSHSNQLSVHTTTGRFLLVAQLYKTHCPMTFGIRYVQWTLSDSRWRRFSFSQYWCTQHIRDFYKNGQHKSTVDIWHLFMCWVSNSNLAAEDSDAD